MLDFVKDIKMEKRYFVIEVNSGIKYCGYGKKCFGLLGNMGIKFDTIFSVSADDTKIISMPQKPHYIFTIDDTDLILPLEVGNNYIKEINKKFNLNLI